MLDSPSNQIDFEEGSGLKKVAQLLKDVQVEEHVRLKCGEFVLLLIGHVYVKENTPIHKQMKNLFGEQCVGHMGRESVWIHPRLGAEADGPGNTSKESCQVFRALLGKCHQFVMHASLFSRMTVQNLACSSCSSQSLRSFFFCVKPVLRSLFV
ncbi:hypothetical protein BRADI_1g42490v3 [Brachypodium distachyon]|uniref:Uncharacterized protein n=1 Tax=Brachypodium distachyon TaxID=15368 RepID=A0A2K2DNX0_BRADI|nr:hypothetical protein BRADI_1g42490v3 [Brachypodium distachyon]PNT75980.1 hypothetical protein BRADI_1g42490v3 [Brachypodium distachyon]PNT75981.1 hypothetical protein BRADI_1g42490v3 [Brachypodium distachyon]